MVDPRTSTGLPPKTEWRTPPDVFAWIQDRYGLRFDLDPCTSEDNPLGTEIFYTPRTNGLERSWSGRKVFVNPPYGREISLWTRKAILESREAGTEVVMLLPNSTDAEWFAELSIYAEIVFITHRIKFVGAPGSPRNGSILAYLSSRTPDVDGVSTVLLPEEN
jgi:site-specific DNA-methyltransferase (adenine-specific)